MLNLQIEWYVFQIIGIIYLLVCMVYFNVRESKDKTIDPPPSSLIKVYMIGSIFTILYTHNSFKLMEFGLCGVNGRTAYLSSVGLEIERALGHVTLLRRQVAVNTVRGIPERARNVIP